MKHFIDKLGDPDAAVVVAAMKDVLLHGNAVAHHIRGDIYEVRAHGDKQAFRFLYAEEGKHGQVLLALEAISKKTQKLPDARSSLPRGDLPTGGRAVRKCVASARCSKEEGDSFTEISLKI